MAQIQLVSLLLFLFMFSWVDASFPSTSPSKEGPFRRLKAASRRSDLLRRGDSVSIKYRAELSYAETENIHGKTTSFTSRVEALSKLPVLVLEELEHQIDQLECSPSSVKVNFKNPEIREAVKQACEHDGAAYLVTSHNGCNDDHERAVFKVDGIHETPGQSVLEMSGKQMPFEKAFYSIKVSFGQTVEGHYFRPKRALFPTPRTAFSGNTTATPTGFGAIPTSTATSVKYNLSSEIVDAEIPIPFVELPFQISCANCSTFGYLEVTQGAFEISPTIDFDDGLDVDFIKGGYVDVVAKGVGAHIEVSASPSVSGSFSLPLPTIPFPLAGFAIPGIGSAGLTFQPNVTLGYEIAGGIELTHGFEALVPDGSKITIDFGDFSNSSVTGFNETSIAALPFSANISAPSLTLTAAFVPKVSFGFDFLNGKSTADVNVFANLPLLKTTISALEDVDADCNPLSNSSSASNTTSNAPFANSTTPTPTTTSSNSSTVPPAVMQSILSSLGPLTFINSSITLDLGLGAELAIIEGVGKPIEASVTLLSKEFVLPTACLAFQPSAFPFFAPANKAVEAAKESYLASVSAAAAAAAAASATAKAQGSPGAFAPTGRSVGTETGTAVPSTDGNAGGRLGVSGWCLGALVVVAGLFVGL